MQTLTRHVLWELTKVFLVALFATTGFLLLVGVGREGTRHGLSPDQILRIIPYVLPEAMKFTLPAAALFSACLVFGRMSAFNEVVAIKSLGISPLSILFPAYAFAFLLSLSAFWANELAASWGKAGIERMMVEEMDDILLGILTTSRQYSSKNTTLLVKRVEGEKLISPMLTIQGDNDSPPVKVVSEEAVLKSNPEDASLSIQFLRGTVEVGSQATMQILDSFEHTIPLGEIRKTSFNPRLPAFIPSGAIPEAVKMQEEEIEVNRLEAATKAGFALMTGRFDGVLSTHSDVHSLTRQIPPLVENLNRLETESYRRWATGFSCLCFVMVGAPLAILRRNSNFIQIFFLCFVPVLLVYYPLIMLGIDWGKQGRTPPIAVWTGNVVFFAVGLYLLRRVIRY